MLPNKFYGDYYNPNKIVSIDRMFALSLGARTIGKSTGWACHDIDYYVKNKHKKDRCKFMYVRRNQDELCDTIEDFISNPINVFAMNDMYPIKDWDYQKGKVVGHYYLDLGDGEGKQLAGYAVPLSLAHKAKSKDFSTVKNVFYDEMIPEDGRYLGGKANPFLEHTRIMGLLNTIDRGAGIKGNANEVRFVGVGNIDNYMIPSVLSLGADKYLTTETKLLKPKGVQWVIEQTLEVDATKQRYNSDLYSLSDDYYKKYAFDGGVHDNSFIGKPSGSLKPLANFTYLDEHYGIYLNEGYIVYISHKPGETKNNLALTLDDHSMNTLLILAWRDSYAMTLLREAYMRGQIMFESSRARFVINQYMMYGGR